MKHTRFTGNLVIVGFGSIGQGVLPLILRHIDLDPSRIVVVTAEERGHAEAESYGIRFIIEPLTRDKGSLMLNNTGGILTLGKTTSMSLTALSMRLRA